MSLLPPLSYEERCAVLNLWEDMEVLELQLKRARTALLDDLIALERETEDGLQKRKRQERRTERIALETGRKADALEQRRQAHGNRTMYNRGCRCDLCHEANNAWSRYYNAERAKAKRLRAA